MASLTPVLALMVLLHRELAHRQPPSRVTGTIMQPREMPLIWLMIMPLLRAGAQQVLRAQ